MRSKIKIFGFSILAVVVALVALYFAKQYHNATNVNKELEKRLLIENQINVANEVSQKVLNEKIKTLSEELKAALKKANKVATIRIVEVETGTTGELSAHNNTNESTCLFASTDKGEITVERVEAKTKLNSIVIATATAKNLTTNKILFGGELKIDASIERESEPKSLSQYGFVGGIGSNGFVYGVSATRELTTLTLPLIGEFKINGTGSILTGTKMSWLVLGTITVGR
jgi:hypothetical protein